MNMLHEKNNHTASRIIELDFIKMISAIAVMFFCGASFFL